MNFSMLFYILGSFFGFVAVILDSLCAHVLKNKIAPESFVQLNLAIRYIFFHAIILILCSLLKTVIPHKIINFAGVCFVLGILFFSGSLILKNIFQMYSVSKIAPFGGICLITGWLFLIIAAKTFVK